MSSVGKTVAHDSAVDHVRGTATFLDDVPLRRDELLVGFIGSPIASGTLDDVDFSDALKIPGVVAGFTSADVPHNLFGPLFCDEPFLAEDDLLYVGQPLALVAAETQTALLAAKRAVRIDATPKGQPILSIQDAIAAGRFIGPARQIASGVPSEVDPALDQLAGEFEIGGQEQFYLESQAAIAYPDDQNQLVIHSSTQNPTEIQAVVAEVMGLSMHQVVCICKRMGGAFGGKETQAAIPALMAALVALRTRRAARVIYDKDEDMRSTGKRHGYLVKWMTGFEKTGEIKYLKIDFFSNGGAAADLSTSVMERTMMHADNAYYIPNIEINGRVCFTNLPPNTAFRGFGGPQAVAAIENIVEHIAESLELDAYEVRLRNLYGTTDRNVTPYGQRFQRNHLQPIMTQLAQSSDYQHRRSEIRLANEKDVLTMRGISMTPVKFGISFTSKFLNQANALVNIYYDGTIQVSTGGTEMGQGLNTKIRQLVADEMGVCYDDVVVMPTSTEKNNNTSPTAASAGTDLNGAAAVHACRELRRRLDHFAAQRFAEQSQLSPDPQQIKINGGQVLDQRIPDQAIPFAQLTHEARLARVDLGARGFYKTPGIDFDRDAGKGTPFLYYTQGAAVTEVRIDRFTGELSVPRVDVLIDIGRPINPGIDMGQVTGGFIQGMGWCTTECLVYDNQGHLLSHSPTTYKIPAISDVPPVFNCQFFDSDDDVPNIRRSKAVGEPPLLLAVSTWAAVRHALSTVSTNAAGQLRLPATGEEILRCLTVAESTAPREGEAPAEPS